MNRAKLFILLSCIVVFTICVFGQTNPIAGTNAVSAPQIVSGPDFTNRSIIFGFITMIVIGMVFYFQRYPIIEAKRGKETVHYFFELGEWVLAIGISVVSTFFELYKRSTWEHATASLIGPVILLSAFIATYLCIKGISAAAKKLDSQEIEALKKSKMELDAQLTAQKEKTTLTEKQRDTILEFTTCVRKIVDAKMSRLIEMFKSKSPVSIEDVIHGMDPKNQLHVIVSTIYLYFERIKKQEEQLRLGLYDRDPKDPNFFRRVYGWDGKKQDCFIRSAQDLGRLDDPQGNDTALVKCFHSKDGVIVIESCDKSAKKGDFQYFPGQNTYLKSMALYKHIFDHNGTKNALILTLDSSQECLFQEKDEQEIKIFLREMMKRIEYELTVLAIVTAATKSGIKSQG